MQSSDKISFLLNKIRDIETALLHVHSDGLLTLQSAIVQTLHIDVTGNLWFTINKPSQQINEFDKHFYVGLNFYRKGAPFFLNTFGWARLVSDPEEIGDLPLFVQHQNTSDKVLMSVKILTATYCEREKETSYKWYHKCKTYIKSMLAYDDNYNLSFEHTPYLATPNRWHS